VQVSLNTAGPSGDLLLILGKERFSVSGGWWHKSERTAFALLKNEKIKAIEFDLGCEVTRKPFPKVICLKLLSTNTWLQCT
jgi:hypothetical protein